jgi:Ca2+-binding EF-hand superfamily protein
VLNSVGVNYSENGWRHIFYHVDSNHDNLIDEEEFLLFLFPEDDGLLVLL